MLVGQSLTHYRYCLHHLNYFLFVQVHYCRHSHDATATMILHPALPACQHIFPQDGSLASDPLYLNPLDSSCFTATSIRYRYYRSAAGSSGLSPGFHFDLSVLPVQRASGLQCSRHYPTVLVSGPFQSTRISLATLEPAAGKDSPQERPRAWASASCHSH